jgi:hypothetical protein
VSRGRRARLVVGGALVVAVAAALAFELLPGGAKTFTGPGDAFSLSYPGSWQVVPAARLDLLPDHPLAALQSTVGRGSVTITRDVREELDGDRLRTQVSQDFRDRLEDYRLLSAGLVKTRAGSVFVYSYLEPGAPAVHTVALVPAGNHSFLLTGIAAASDKQQIASMISSFRPR